MVYATIILDLSRGEGSMSFLQIMSEPTILIITAFFVYFILFVLRNYLRVEKHLKSVYKTLKSYGKKEISYRFEELNEFMSANVLTSVIWEDFKKALIFPDKLYTASHAQKVGGSSSDIYLTIDSSYFFNEETLVFSNINHRFIQAMPTLLTGLGPFFTFFKMAIAFSVIDFTIINITASLNNLIANIQIAALCSVFAVGYSLFFIFIEKNLYNRRIKKYYLLIQKELIRLFDVCTSETFLLDLVKESKLQSITNEKVLKSLPEDFAKAITKSMGEITTPYLENILYSLNKLNETLDKKSGDDMVDKLF